MAKTFTLTSAVYQGRYMSVTCTQTPDIESNTSKIDWTLTVTGGSSSYYSTGPTTLLIGGQQVYYKSRVSFSKETFPAAKGSISGSITVSHGTDGTRSVDVSLTTAIYSTTTKTASDTWELDSIPRFATITAATDFTDEDNPTITYSNPAGNSVSLLRACISLDGSKDDVAYRDISKTGTSYTFNLTTAERDVLRAATTGSNSRTVKFYVRSEIGSSYEGSNLPRTFTIKNPKPTISPTITDSNSTTVALTGDNKKLVRYYSNAAITMGAAAVKKATLTSKKVVCGSKNLTADGTINAVESGTFTFTATDNRGNTTTLPVKPSFVEYVKLTCNMGNSMPTTDGDMTVKVSGSYFNGSFGAASNTLAVYYRYKVAGGSYSGWKAMTVTKSGNAYTATASLTGLDYQTVYVFQAYAVDKLATVESVERNVKATPVFDWGENDFNFNVPVTILGNAVRAKRCVVGQNSSSDTNPWYKFASVTASALNEDLRISFKVTYAYGTVTRFAILNALIRTANTSGANAVQRLEFESDSGLDRTNFVLAYSGTGEGSVYELWVKLTAYRSCFFEVLSESSRIGYIDKWVLYNQLSAGYAAAPTSGYTQVTATKPYLLNLYPVGIVVTMYNNDSPEDLFGGTWQRIESRMLYGCATSGTVGATGTHTTGSGSSSLPYVNVAHWRRTA